MRWLIAGSLALLVLYPVAWVAPLLRAGLLPIFGMDKISIWSGIVSLWETDIFLALVVAFFALIAPYAKILAMAAVQIGRAGPRTLRIAEWSGRLAMADIFLISLYIALSKGIGVGRVETAWGLYLFTACIFSSLLLSWMTEHRIAATARAN
ncbi:paraquat-inducible protein A [Pseudooceanicola sp. LIPI14-2-Ac024]|uniref:paraquat-inducible protein A n=1 Tax=Pseudooceanicola sp. LIPI14-2-Ac024 TaxID=3344875 RepID=UPI0035D11D45